MPVGRVLFCRFAIAHWVPSSHEVEMVVMRIAVLCGCGLALGGCLPLMSEPQTYASPSPMAVSDAALPPVMVPGQVLQAGLGGMGGGVNPSDDLLKSERARAAWGAQRPFELALPPSLAAHTASASRMTDPTSKASVLQPAKGVARHSVDPQSYDREATMDRLEKEGQKDAKPICSGC